MATSRLQRRAVKEIDRVFGCHAVQENLRPDWLIGPNGHRLELDIYIPAIKTAIEIQGPQHYRFSEHFHGTADGFNQRLTREYRRKLKIAEREYERQKALWVRVPREQRNFEIERTFLKAESRLYKRRDQLRRAEERARRGEWRGSNYIVSMGRCVV